MRVIHISFASVNHFIAEHSFMSSACKPFVRLGLNCSAPMENKRDVPFPRKQQHVASSVIEPGAINLSVGYPALHQLSYLDRN